MLRRNKVPQVTSPRDHSNNKFSQHLETRIFNAHSPPPPFTRIERKPTEEHKSSSLGNRFKVKAFQSQEHLQSPPSKAPTQKTSDRDITNDYYPQPQNPSPENNANHPPLPPRISQQGPPKQVIKQSFRSTPVLPLNPDLEQRKQRDSISTQLSKQQSIEQKVSLKEVRFGEVIEESRQVFLKKREKVRSPSILKNGGRNILNGSIVSAEKQRSCSVASGRERREKQKHKNEHSINHIIKQKYQTTLNRLQAEFRGKNYTRNNRFSAATYQTQKPVVTSPFKYKDDIFPPVYSSLFNSRKHKPRLGSEIKWMRLGTLFKERELVLAKPNYTSLQIYKVEDSYCEDYFPGALNSLLSSPKLLERMFEDQQVNEFGIYLVKIYQESIWKYIIVDDYIPVMEDENGKMRPAYLDVRVPHGAPIDIWPFLLEKAYANYYSSYEALQSGNIVDFIEELAGTPSEKIRLKSQSHKKGKKMKAQQMEVAFQRVIKILKGGNVVALGELEGQQGHAPLNYHIFKGQLFWSDPFCEFKQRKISFDTLKENFTSIYLISPFKNTSCFISILRKSRVVSRKKLGNNLYEPDYPSIRKFEVKTAGEYQISIRQRDKRFFHFKQNYGAYIWVRAILLQKQYEQTSYRWISGEYSNQKAINFTNYLENGEYYLLLEAQWHEKSPSQLMIHLCGPAECQFVRQPYREEDRIIEKGCLDLAQRYGELNQINKFICSYNYITEAVGLIIENIVNERVTGNVSVMRSIRGLKCKSEILPVNIQFYEKVMSGEGDPMLKLNEEIELDIGEGQQFTVVLKMKGGIDSKFFRTFDFGG